VIYILTTTYHTLRVWVKSFLNTMTMASVATCILFAAFIANNCNAFVNRPALIGTQPTVKLDSYRIPTNNFAYITSSNQYNKLYRTLLNASDDASSEKKPLQIIIAGAPASGKGTQCENIKNTYGVVHLSTGDMLREAVAAETEVGLAAKEYMNAGKLVPDEVIIGIVKDRLEQNDCQTQGWLLDGFPRTKAQADALAATGVKADCFLFLNVPDEMIVERVVGRRTDPETGKIYHMKFSPPTDDEVISRLVHRADDTEDAVVVRLKQFHDNFDSVKECYDDIMHEIDGSTKPDVVGDAISDILSNC